MGPTRTGRGRRADGPVALAARSHHGHRGGGSAGAVMGCPLCARHCCRPLAQMTSLLLSCHRCLSEGYHLAAPGSPVLLGKTQFPSSDSRCFSFVTWSPRKESPRGPQRVTLAAQLLTTVPSRCSSCRSYLHAKNAPGLLESLS